MKELESRLDKLEGVLSQQGQVLQQLSAQLGGGGAAQAHVVATPSPNAPPTDPALYMQAPNPYPAIDAANHGRASMQAGSSTAHQRQQQQQESNFMHNGAQAGMQIPVPPASNDPYSVNHPALESPSLNIPGHATHEGAMNAVSQDQDFPPYVLPMGLAAGAGHLGAPWLPHPLPSALHDLGDIG